MTDKELITYLRFQGLDKDVIAADRIQALNAKLAKAAEALEDLADCVDDGCFCSEMKMGASVDKARATLAELENMK